MSRALAALVAFASAAAPLAAQTPSSDFDVRRGDVLWALRAELGADYGGELITVPGDDGDDVLVGRPRQRDAEGRLTGRVEWLDGATGGLRADAGWFGPPTRERRGDGFAQELAWLDGAAPRLAIARTRARSADAPLGALGEMFVVSPDAPLDPIARLQPLDERTFFGTHVVALDDVDGDGFDDVAVASAPRRVDLDGDTGGRVDVVSSGTGERLAGWTCPDGVFGFGAALATGDVDGDGRADVIVGSQRGAPDDETSTDVWVHVYDVGGEELASWSGTSVVDVRVMYLGDVDGDGAGEFVLVGPRLDEGPDDVPTLSVVSTAERRVVYASFRSNRRADYGRALANLGDVDGDGVADFAVSEPLVTRMWDGRGRVYLVSGAGGEPLGSLTPDRLDAAFGLDMAAGQLVPGGPPELVVRASAIDLEQGELDELRAYDLASVLESGGDEGR